MKIKEYTVDVGEVFSPPAQGLPPSNYDPQVHQCMYRCKMGTVWNYVESMSWMCEGSYRLDKRVEKNSRWHYVYEKGSASTSCDSILRLNDLASPHGRVFCVRKDYENGILVDYVVTRLNPREK